MLDSDTVCHGLSSNLGLSEANRRENTRRIGEAVKLMPSGDFLEIYCKVSLETCEAVEVKGCAKKCKPVKSKKPPVLTLLAAPEKLELVVMID